MLIYTTHPDGAKLPIVRRWGMGVMITSGSTVRMNRAYKGLPICLDNGAFGCWRRGYPFMEAEFLETLDAAYRTGYTLQWIVCPDLVARGLDSLEFSLAWEERLRGARLLLAVQDGMTERHLHAATVWKHFVGLFVGGTVEWKWKTAPRWSAFAKAHQMILHIGRCGTLAALQRAHSMGADSVDSASFARNDSWHIVERFQSGGQQSLFYPDQTEEA